MNRTVRLYTIVALGTIAGSGLLEGTRGVVLPYFMDALRLDPSAGSRVFAASAVGYLFTSLTFGSLSQRLGLKRVSRLGLALSLIMLALFLLLRSPWPLLLVNAALGAGLSMIGMASDLPISLLYGEQQSGMLNLLHGFFGGGALMGSLWAALWFGLGASWEVTFGSAAVLIFLWALAYQALPALPALPLPAQAPVQAPQAVGVAETAAGAATPAPSPPPAGSYGPLLRDPLTWAAALALFAAVVGEIGLTLWLPTYLQVVKGLAPATSALALSLFFAGFTGMRLTGAWLVSRVGEVRSVIGLAMLGAAGVALLLYLPPMYYWLAVPAGMGAAIGFATCTALVATRYPTRVNQVYTVMYSAGGLAGIVTGPLMGWIAMRSGYTAAMSVVVLSYLAQALLLAFYGWATRRR